MDDKVVYAKGKNLRISPRKLRLVARLIKGKPVVGMTDKLALMNSKSADVAIKVLESAISNATNNNEYNKEKLMVVDARVDEGFVIKRGKAVSKGRFHQIKRRNSHLTIGLIEVK